MASTLQAAELSAHPALSTEGPEQKEASVDVPTMMCSRRDADANLFLLHIHTQPLSILLDLCNQPHQHRSVLATVTCWMPLTTHVITLFVGLVVLIDLFL
jgi:hypothetical protein